nr:LysR family substrate-binding domain-containing protein [Nocardioides sp. zg-DK7169]
MRPASALTPPRPRLGGVSAFRVGFVTGATPDKWARAWRERSRVPLELVPVEEDEQEAGLRDGSLDMCLVRLPIDREGLHCIPLYEEVPVVVAGHEHFVAAADEVSLADLEEEQLVLPHRSGWTPSAAQLEWPAMGLRDAVEVVASGTGIVLVPMSIARLHHRKDVIRRPVTDLPPTTVGLAWLIDNEDPRVQTFIGIVRGRTARSSRG